MGVGQDRQRPADHRTDGRGHDDAGRHGPAASHAEAARGKRAESLEEDVGGGAPQGDPEARGRPERRHGRGHGQALGLPQRLQQAPVRHAGAAKRFGGRPRQFHRREGCEGCESFQAALACQSAGDDEQADAPGREPAAGPGDDGAPGLHGPGRPGDRGQDAAEGGELDPGGRQGPLRHEQGHAAAAHPADAGQHPQDAEGVGVKPPTRARGREAPNAHLLRAPADVGGQLPPAYN
mmetsp:Transcript_31376/g.85118  ORF Transcript_31376/g.85118 Transcript_31376/m.85118 type:complete len:236 (+) Transcript_31376:392-1099(+)